jgi:hypothetical protein
MAWPLGREKRRKRMNEEEKERLFSLASDLKVLKKNGKKSGVQERKKGCMVVYWIIS